MWRERAARTVQVFTLGNAQTGERFTRDGLGLAADTGLPYSVVRDLIAGRIHTASGWAVMEPKYEQPELLGPKHPPQPQRKMRRCLGPGCGVMFLSDSPSMRRCPACARRFANSAEQRTYPEAWIYFV